MAVFPIRREFQGKSLEGLAVARNKIFHGCHVYAPQWVSCRQEEQYECQEFFVFTAIILLKPSQA
jgi:hypothetical protein